MNSTELQQRLKELEVEPYLDSVELTAYGFSNSLTSRELIDDVEVRKIVGSHEMKNWADIQRDEEYILRMTNAIRKGELDLLKTPPDLGEIDGVYFIESDGRTRVAVAKILNLKTIPAYVTRYKINKILTDDIRGIIVMLKRRREGYWKGKFKFSISKVFGKRKIYLTGYLNSIEGVWVVSKNLESVKKIMQDLKR